MSHIVFLGSPAYGHVNPTLPVVQELVQRGESVLYYNHEEFRPLIERTGAAFHPYPDAISAQKITAALQDGDLSNVSGLVLSATQDLVPFLLDDLPHQSADLVIFDSLALWGRIAATRLNLPAAASITHFVLDAQRIMSENTHALRYLWHLLPKLPRLLITRTRLSRQYGEAFPKGQPLIPVRGGLNLMFTARALQPETSIIDDSFRFVGPSINPQTRDQDFPLDVLRQATSVYISLGTVHHGQTAFYRQCFEAFADYPAQFVLSIGKHTDPTTLGAIPPNFMVRPSVPQLAVLQQVNAFITHGGMNSIHEALYFGVPLIIIPQQLEQLLNGRSVEAQGAGLVLDKPLARQPMTATELRQALDAVLSQPAYREGARHVQTLLQATGGYRQAADEIQAYLAQVNSTVS